MSTWESAVGPGVCIVNRLPVPRVLPVPGDHRLLSAWLL